MVKPTIAVISRLLSCPFCAGSVISIEPDEVGSGGQWVGPIHVGCAKCHAEQCGDTEEDAIAAWNRRPPACSERVALSDGMHVTCLTAPERIWLQSDPECASDEPPKFPVDDEATWCRDRINKSDTLYIRADLVEPARGDVLASGQIKEPASGILPVKESDHD